MTPLSATRCREHPNREAVARCPECRGFYCRECINEFKGRMICTRCLEKLAAGAGAGKGKLSRKLLHGIGWAAAALLGAVLAGLIFYAILSTFSHIPADFSRSGIFGSFRD